MAEDGGPQLVGESRSFLVRIPGSSINESISIAYTQEAITVQRGGEPIEIPRQIWDKMIRPL